MSPELRISLPDEKEKAFVEVISHIDGVKVVGRKASPEERKKISDERNAEFQKLLDSLRKPRSRKIQARINSGYRELLKDILETQFNLTRSIGVRELKGVFIDIFGRSRMQEVRALVLRYGLIDGAHRTYKEVGRSMGLSQTRARHWIIYGGVRMRRPLGPAGIGLIQRTENPR